MNCQTNFLHSAKRDLTKPRPQTDSAFFESNSKILKCHLKNYVSDPYFSLEYNIAMIMGIKKQFGISTLLYKQLFRVYPMHILKLNYTQHNYINKNFKERTGKVSGTQETPNKSWLNEARGN